MALHRALGHPAHGRDLSEGKATEELEVDDLGERGIDRGELVEGRANPDQLFDVGPALADFAAQGRDLEAAAALLGLAAARIVDDEAAHHLRGIGHEASTVGEDRSLALGDVEVGLVEQGGGAEGHACPAARQLALGQPVQVRVQAGEKRVRSGAIATLG